jgi:hypothetical protein
VVTATPAPAETKVESATTTVKTFTATVIVIDSRGNVVPGATVTFNGKTATTDKNGKASFIGVTAGSYLVKATSGSLTASTNVTVNAKNKTTQNFMVTLPKAKSNRFGFLLGAGITGTIIGGGLVYMNRKRAVKVVEEVKKVAKKTPKVSTRLANASK